MRTDDWIKQVTDDSSLYTHSNVNGAAMLHCSGGGNKKHLLDANLKPKKIILLCFGVKDLV